MYLAAHVVVQVNIEQGRKNNAVSGHGAAELSPREACELTGVDVRCVWPADSTGESVMGDLTHWKDAVSVRGILFILGGESLLGLGRKIGEECRCAALPGTCAKSHIKHVPNDHLPPFPQCI